MRYQLYFVFALVINFTAQSQEFTVDTIMRSGKLFGVIEFYFCERGLSSGRNG
jgi:hypothetical protein